MFSSFISTRREFLGQGLGVLGVGAAVPAFLARAALAAPPARTNDNILVVVQLSGGHDGLSAIVPRGNDDYGRNRTATRIAEKDILKINDDVGFHPNLKGCADLLEQKGFAIVQGVGYPNPNRSHFKSMDIWHYADNTGRPVSYGWLGRYADSAHKGDTSPALAVAIGGDRAPRAMQGREHAGLSLQRPEAYRFLADARLGETHRKLTRAPEGGTNSNLEFVARTAADGNASSEQIQKLAARRQGGASYPAGGLGTALQTVATLLNGGLGTRVFYVFQGGFDTHAGQRQRHDRLMTELNDALVAFQKDLKAQGNAKRVLTITFSEFGRRVRENGSQGTDHGTAGPMFLIGPGVKAGLHGKHPSLAAADLDNGDLKFGIDFRSVYATVLEKWLGTPSEPVLGAKYPLLDCLA